MKTKKQSFCKALFLKIALLTALILGGGNSAWADTVYFDGSTGNQISKWTTTDFSYSYGNSYLYINNIGGTITSDEPITLSSSKKLVISARSYLGDATNSKIAVKYSDDGGSSYSTICTFNSSNITSSYADLQVDGLDGSYTIQLECDYIRINLLKVVETDPYPAPSDFLISSFTSTTATFAWTAGNDESAWQIAYSTSSDFTPGTGGTTIDITTSDLSDSKYTLTGLTEGTTYYAAIRANYNGGNYSEWTDKVAFTPNDEVEILKYDGSEKSYNIPISSSNVNNNTALTRTQFIIPAADLTSIQNRQITKLTFYASQNSVTWGAATFEVYLKETNNTSYSTSDKKFESWGTCVYNNQGLSTNSTNGQMEITLNTPFNYTTGNLMIGFKQLTKGTKPSTPPYWYSTTSYSYNAIYSYATTVTVTSYSPKVTILTVAPNTAPVKIGATGYTTFASSWPLDLSNLPSGLTAYYVASGDVDGSVAYLTPITTAVAAGTGLILKGTANTTYAIPVAASGSDISESNLMVGVTPLETALAVNATSGYNNYVLVNNSGTPQFQSLSENGATIPGGKAYLRNGEYSGESRALSIIFGNEGTTGIVSHNRETVTTQRYYNLQGQRITKPQKGINIVNGKKMIIK